MNCSSAQRCPSENHSWLLFLFLCSYLCMASTIPLDWTRLHCGLFIVLAFGTVSAAELLCVWYHAQDFHSYQSSFFSGNNGRSMCSLCSSFGQSASTSRMYPLLLLSIQLRMITSLNLNKSFLYLKPFTGTFCDIAHPCNLLTYDYMRYKSSFIES